MHPGKDIFISYSRRQLSYASRLSQKLIEKGYSIWFDQNDIPLGVDFLAEIERSIRQSDNFLLILSPDSIASPYCRKEIGYAIEYGKRIVPVLSKAITPAEQAELPEDVARLNWIDGQETTGENYARALEKLVQLLTTGSETIRLHTLLTCRASDWRDNLRHENYLLPGQARLQAEEWLADTVTAIHPPCRPSDLLCEYICESRKSAKRGATDFFVCYATTDRAVRDRFCMEFTRNGISTWRHDADISAGIQFGQAILDGIEQADSFLLLLSPASLESDYCRREIAHAEMLGKRIFVLDLHEGKTPDVPVSLATLQHVQLAGEDALSIHEASARLLREMNTERQYNTRYRELLVEARSWEKQGFAECRLLRARPLLQAETWLNLSSARADRFIFPLVVDFIRKSTESGAHRPAEVFIANTAYDADLAARLADALRANGKPTYFDRERSEAENFEETELPVEISNSDNFLFLFSPGAPASSFCESAKNIALQQGKRVIVAAVESDSYEKLPQEMREHPFIDFSGRDFETALAELVQLLSVDRIYLKKHTRWLQAAMQWDEHGRSNDLLLHSKNLAEANEWLAEAENKKQEPAPTSLQREFIRAALVDEKDALEIERRREEYLAQLEKENQDLKNADDMLAHIGLVDRLDATEENHAPFLPEQHFAGRTAELELIGRTIEEVKQGACRLVLVNGEEGVGKTAFLREAFREASGKIYWNFTCQGSTENGAPFALFARLADDMIAQLLTDEKALAAVKERVEMSLHGNGRVLLEIMPRLELLIGPQPPVPDLDPNQNLLRLQLTLASFFRSLLRDDQQLAIFVDEMHHAGKSMLDMLGYLLSPAAGLRSFLVVGANLTSADGFAQVQQSFGKLSSGVTDLSLHHLSLAALNEWLMQLLGGTSFLTEPLAKAVFSLTEGNALLTQQLLRKLQEHALIRWEVHSRSWKWDLDAIAAFPVEHDVALHSLKTVRGFDGPLQEMLSVAAAIGMQFEWTQLKNVYERVFIHALPDFLRLARERLIIPVGDAYKLLLGNEEEALPLHPQFRFASARIRQAALDNTDPQVLKVIRYEIVRRAIREPGDKSNDQIYFIASHLNACADLLRGQSIRLKAARYNLAAGEQALQASAHQSALEYFGFGSAHLEPVPAAWDKHYELGFQLHFQYAGALFFAGRMEEATKEMETLIGKVKSRHDKAICYVAFCSALQSMGKAAENLARAREGLGLFDVHFPSAEEEYAAETGELITLLTEEGVPQRLAELEKAGKEPMLIGDLYNSSISGVYFAEPHHLPWICSRNLAHVLKNGYTSGTRLAMAWFSMILFLTGRHELSFEYAELVIDPSPRNTDPPLARGRATMIAWAMSLGWKYPFRKTEEALAPTFHQCQNNGDLQYASYVLISIYIARLLHADDLTMLLKHCRTWRDHCARFAPLELGHARIRTTALQRLMGLEPDEPVDAEKIIATYEAEKNNTDVCESLIELARIDLLFHEDETAYTYCKRAEPIIEAGAAGSLLLNLLHEHVYAICCARVYRRRMDENQEMIAQQYAAQAGKLIAKLKVIATLNPGNFDSYYTLAEAEWHAAQDEQEEACAFFLRTLSHSRTQGYTLLEAMANEGLGRLYAKKNYRFAGAHLEEAVLLYMQCSAKGKARRLETELQELTENHRLVSYSKSVRSVDENDMIRVLQQMTAAKERGDLLQIAMKRLAGMMQAKQASLFYDSDHSIRALASVSAGRVELFPGALPPVDVQAWKKSGYPVPAGCPEKNGRCDGAVVLTFSDDGKRILLYAEPEWKNFSASQQKIAGVILEQLVHLWEKENAALPLGS